MYRRKELIAQSQRRRLAFLPNATLPRIKVVIITGLRTQKLLASATRFILVTLEAIPLTMDVVYLMRPLSLMGAMGKKVNATCAMRQKMGLPLPLRRHPRTSTSRWESPRYRSRAIRTLGQIHLAALVKSIVKVVRKI